MSNLLLLPKTSQMITVDFSADETVKIFIGLQYDIPYDLLFHLSII